MPLKSISRSPGPGHLIQVCAGCGAEHRISLDRGAQKARTGPVTLQVGGTLEVRVDARAPQTIVFTTGDFADFAHATAAELATKIQRALLGVIASDDAGGLLLESTSTGAESRIEITGGTARAALGFTHGVADPCPGRPVLGVSFGPGSVNDPNILALRRCNDCGANECLVRTLDASAPELDGTHFKEHRRVVNTLAEHCRARGWSHLELAAHHAADPRCPIDVHAEFPERWELAKVVRQSPGQLAGQPTQVLP